MGTRKKEILVFLITVLGVIAIDQLTKVVVVAYLSPGDSVTVIPKMLKFTHIKNPGAAFGLFSGSSQIILWSALIIVGVTIILIYWMRDSGKIDTWTLVALGLLMGGAFGNLIDRIFRGKVVDFVDFGWWPVFNAADIAIVAGVIILLVKMLIELYTDKKISNEGNGGER